MKKWLITALIILFIATPTLASAQSDLTISSLQIDILPEYDRTDVLVMYHIFLSSDTTLPVDMTLRIPTPAGDPFNLALRGTDGQLYVVDYEKTVDGEWTAINFTARSTEIRLEYYDPDLMKNGPERTFTYTWPGDYAVDSISVLVEEPIDATEMQITPDLGAGVPSEGNLLDYSAILGSYGKGETFEVSFQYQKDTDRLSVSALNVEPASPISETVTGGLTASDIIPWGIGVLAILLVAGGSWWYWQSGKTEDAPKSRQRHRAAREPEPEAQSGDENQIYCHSCGKRAAPGDAFCRACGAKLRKEEGS